ncbi:major capsid protein [Undibacterium oligocarboniphilum]|uniref:Methyltransferase n=1 Tax=Undibacterium oligocarboniphilum TaxID=666702 RepID=A0A850QJQ3_9BURK|nr:major capsid protein [Undibacterium oligocarboniphilum]MBC3871918.1 methyltransferase [Undibacterium oligocarboniphilum]NVO79498.1 methyltransferase [Undibacterium oligocarboniphilum]
MKLSQIKNLGLAAGVMLVSFSASAAVDTSAVTSAITDAGAAVATVGAAVLVLHVGMKVYKWVSRAL